MQGPRYASGNALPLSQAARLSAQAPAYVRPSTAHTGAPAMLHAPHRTQ